MCQKRESDNSLGWMGVCCSRRHCCCCRCPQCRGGTFELEKCGTPETPWQGGDGLAQAEQPRGEGCWAQPRPGTGGGGAEAGSEGFCPAQLHFITAIALERRSGTYLILLTPLGEALLDGVRICDWLQLLRCSD